MIWGINSIHHCALFEINTGVGNLRRFLLGIIITLKKNLKGKNKMAPSIKEMQAALVAKANKNKNNEEGQKKVGDGASYAFWNLPEGGSSTIRFLPDGNTENLFFWVERQMIKLTFDGVNGGDYPTSKTVEVTVPCVDMFGMACPIIAATRALWKGTEAEKQVARSYYKKRSYVTQGFVVNSGFEEKDVPENPIRRFVLGPQIYKIIYQSLVDPQFEDNPSDLVGGREFILRKGRQGDFASYSTSNWSFKPRSLSETEQAAIDRYGLRDLTEFLGPRPDTDTLDAIKAMFEDSINGNPFDYDSYGKYYRPFEARSGASNDHADDVDASAVTSTRVTPPRETAPEVSAAVSPKSAATGRSDPKDIVARIKQRTQQQA